MKRIISITVIFFHLTNCSSKKNNLQNESFEYQNRNKKIFFEILTGNKYLVENIVTKTKFKFENIDPKMATISGKTIRFVMENNAKENELFIEMSPKNEDLENGKLKIILFYKNDEEHKTFRLNIPVKTE